MNSIYCLACGQANFDDCKTCIKCGASLSDEQNVVPGLGIATAASSSPLGNYVRVKEPKVIEPYTPSRHAGRRYPALRFIAAVSTVLAYTVLLLAVLLAGFIFIAPMLKQPQNSLLAAGCVVMGGLGFLSFLLVAESIAVVVDIEADARRIVHLLERSGD
jgi:hypothetical protein